MKGSIVGINEIVMDDFTTKWSVTIIFDEIPDLKIGNCDIKMGSCK